MGGHAHSDRPTSLKQQRSTTSLKRDCVRGDLWTRRKWARSVATLFDRYLLFEVVEQSLCTGIDADFPERAGQDLCSTSSLHQKDKSPSNPACTVPCIKALCLPGPSRRQSLHPVVVSAAGTRDQPITPVRLPMTSFVSKRKNEGNFHRKDRPCHWINSMFSL